jgi:hypothetical protein
MFNVRENLAARESEFVEIGPGEATFGDRIRRKGLGTFRKALLNGKITEACA